MKSGKLTRRFVINIKKVFSQLTNSLLNLHHSFKVKIPDLIFEISCESSRSENNRVVSSAKSLTRMSFLVKLDQTWFSQTITKSIKTNNRIPDKTF